MRPIRRELRDAILRLDGVLESDSAFDPGEKAFFVNGTQMAGFGPAGTIGVRLTKQVVRAERDRLRADTRVEIPYSGSDWVNVTVRSVEDVPFALELVELAASQYRPPTGIPARLPPQGPDLERRRRWH